MRTRALPLLLLPALVPGCASPMPDTSALIHERIAASGAQVGLYYRHLSRPDSLLHDPDLRMHAASTMKVPVMIQVYRDADAGLLALDDRIAVTNTFASLVDGSPFSVSPADDSDTTLYGRVGGAATVRELVELMITVSSNLATNILVQRVDAARVTATMRELGADSIQVLRGVEDGKAYDAGLSNTTTARDLGIVAAAIAEGRAASARACREMEAVLGRQHFGSAIPAGVPAGVTVAHKTGGITRIHHDFGIVTALDGTRYVLALMVRGLDSRDSSAALMADLSRLVYEHAMRAPRQTGP
jgi:beta-lactamase class A